MKFLKKFFTEYLFLNLFIFGCVSLLSLAIINISFFDPFTEAFQDFSLTDLYYTKEKDRNQINKGPVVLINVEDKDRSQVAYLLQQIQKGKPKVVALDIVYAQRINQQDSLLKAEFTSHNNYVFSYIADFDNLQESVYTDSFFTTQRDGYATMVADNIEYSTIRHYYPFNDNRQAFTSAIIKKYDSALYQQLLKRKNKKTEIHYTGNLSNFSYYDFDEVTDPDFNASALQNKIVLLGYLGMPKVNAGNRQDEDKFFTPLNSRLSGRSHPDMYGCVIHANILRMILDNDYIKVVPPWRVFLVSFILLWLILPFMCGLFFKGDLWFNSVGTLVQLIGSFIIVALSVFTYKYFNTKFDPGLLTGCLVLLPTFINLYEALLMFLRYKLKIRFRSAFLSKDHNY
ncbi:MAG: CHASE2 domain-containing protein [Chitinophagaceae bacterium]|nr:CHASE2 domain-containing protein [Chitinophagaceae bacterium]